MYQKSLHIYLLKSPFHIHSVLFHTVNVFWECANCKAFTQEFSGSIIQRLLVDRSAANHMSNTLNLKAHRQAVSTVRTSKAVTACLVKSKNRYKLKCTKANWPLSFHLRQSCHKACHLTINTLIHPLHYCRLVAAVRCCRCRYCASCSLVENCIFVDNM